MENKGNRAANQVVLGLLVMGIGVLFLLDNLDIFDLRHAIGFWPLVFIIGGVVTLAGGGPRSGTYMGMVLLGFGFLMILGRLGFFTVRWNTMWPLVLIALGGLILYRTVGPGRVARPDLKDGTRPEDVVDIAAVLGGFERRLATPDFRGGEITAVMGGCALDLRESSIVKEAVINVFVIWGGINIRIPPDWTVVLNGTPIMGGFSEKTLSVPNTGKRLVITGYAIMGGVEVRT
jgi:hypothetical protein